MSALARRLLLKPYGDELLTRGGDFWIFSARLIIVTMALAEAIAWGYMGALMSRSHPWIAASIAGLFVFILVWIIDATFMTLDLSRAFYERVLIGKKASPVQERVKLIGGIAARVAIVSASLFITAPFLAQAIFAADVQEEMTRRNAGAVSTRRAQIEQPFLQQLSALRNEQKVLEQQRVQEAAGTGLSGKYGRGPALETIETQLAEKRQEIATVESARAEALARFDSLSPAQLEQQHGLRFLAPGVHASGELLEGMLDTPQFSGAELAIRAFLAFLFLGLLILKLFQPRSIAVYFNEQLHSVHDEYRKGLFDHDLPEAERAGAGGSMDPLRFEDWCVNTYASIRRDDERRREAARESRLHELLVEQWQRLGGAARNELAPLIERYQASCAATEALEAELHAARTRLASVQTELQNAEATHQSVLQHIHGTTLEGQVFEQAVAAANEVDTRRRALTEKSAAETRAIDALTQKLARHERERATLASEIAVRQSVIADAETRIGADRLRLSSILVPK
jgi:hypothetical protein